MATYFVRYPDFSQEEIGQIREIIEREGLRALDHTGREFKGPDGEYALISPDRIQLQDTRPTLVRKIKSLIPGGFFEQDDDKEHSLHPVDAT